MERCKPELSTHGAIEEAEGVLGDVGNHRQMGKAQQAQAAAAVLETLKEKLLNDDYVSILSDLDKNVAHPAGSIISDLDEDVAHPADSVLSDLDENVAHPTDSVLSDLDENVSHSPDETILTLLPFADTTILPSTAKKGKKKARGANSTAHRQEKKKHRKLEASDSPSSAVNVPEWVRHVQAFCAGSAALSGEDQAVSR